MHKIIVTDLDKTLLRDGGFISDYTVSVLEKCRARGIKIAFATARSKQSAARFIKQFKPDIFIGYGGALAAEGEKIISRFAIPVEISNQIISECLTSAEIRNVHAVNESAALTSAASAMDMTDSSHYIYFDFSKGCGMSFLKISAFTPNPEAAERLAEKYPPCKLVRYSGEELFTLINRAADKWNSIKAVADYYGMGTDSFIAFGDDLNDLEMIKNCGTGVAVGNAIEPVKAAADFICGTNENDGAAKWLEKYLEEN